MDTFGYIAGMAIGVFIWWQASSPSPAEVKKRNSRK